MRTMREDFEREIIMKCHECNMQFQKSEAQYIRYIYDGMEIRDYFCPFCESIVSGHSITKTDEKEFPMFKIPRGCLNPEMMQLFFWYFNIDKYLKGRNIKNRLTLKQYGDRIEI